MKINIMKEKWLREAVKDLRDKEWDTKKATKYTDKMSITYFQQRNNHCVLFRVFILRAFFQWHFFVVVGAALKYKIRWFMAFIVVLVVCFTQFPLCVFDSFRFVLASHSNYILVNFVHLVLSQCNGFFLYLSYVNHHNRTHSEQNYLILGYIHKYTTFRWYHLTYVTQTCTLKTKLWTFFFLSLRWILFTSMKLTILPRNVLNITSIDTDKYTQ